MRTDKLIAAALWIAALVGGCALFEDLEEKRVEYCPGFTGSDTCCSVDDPCGWAGDGACDCDGTCTWDLVDCGLSGDDYCPGYVGSNECCKVSNPCGWANDWACDCDGACSWDWEDCGNGSGWGQVCYLEYPECPSGSDCIAVTGMPEHGLGYCSPICYDFGSADSYYCTEMGTGTEWCALENAWDIYHCAILCDGSEDCPNGMTCQDVPESETKICYPWF